MDNKSLEWFPFNKALLSKKKSMGIMPIHALLSKQKKSDILGVNSKGMGFALG